MVEITITEDSVTPFLRIIEAHSADFSEPIKLILEDALSQARERFVTKGPGPMVEEWLPAAAGTHYPPGESLLMRSQLLLGSLTPGGPGAVFEVTPTSGFAGTEIFYAGFQQYGTSRGIPPRPFLGWSEESLPGYDVIVWNHVFGDMEEEPRFG